MTKRAVVSQADYTRAVRGVLKAGWPVGSFKVVVENGRLEVLPLAANEPSDPAAEAARRIREAFDSE